VADCSRMFVALIQSSVNLLVCPKILHQNRLDQGCLWLLKAPLRWSVDCTGFYWSR